MDGISIVVPSYDVAVSLLATKYLAASGLICVLWDHMLTFTDEVKYIWIGGRWDYVRVLFLLNRYMNEAGLLYTAYIFSGLHSPLDPQTGYERSARCVGFMTAIATLAVISISTANVFMTLRYYALWDHRRSVIVALWSAFGVSYMTIFVLFILTVSDFHDHAQYSPFLQTCILSNKPMSLVGIWASMLAFDVFTLVLAVAGALERPYRHNVDVIVNFQRDGAIFFIALTSLRILNLALSIRLEAEEIFLVAFFVWGMISLTMSRLILRLEAIKARPNQATAIHLYDMNRSYIRDA